MTKMLQLPIAFRFARRELRHQLKSFLVFLVCVALGVAAIGGINGISQFIQGELSSQGKVILGGDLRFSLNQQPAASDELQIFHRLGNVSASINMRTMVRNQATGNQILAEIKAVDSQYPLYGEFATKPRFNSALLAEDSGHFGVIVAPYLLQSLEMKLGDELQIGNLTFIIRGIIDNEPDLISENFLLGPRVFIAKPALEKTGLIAQGSLLTYVYKIAVANKNDKSLAETVNNIQRRLADSGWHIRSRLNASPFLRENIARFLQFLSLIGLTSLIIGGLGVYNAVATYIAKKTHELAIFKALGATTNFISTVFICQVLILAVIGIVIGGIIAIAFPILAAIILAHYLPVSHYFVIYPKALIIAAIYALLTIIAFALPPLGRIGKTSTVNLLRNEHARTLVKTAVLYRLASLVCLTLIIAMAIIQAQDKRLTFLFLVCLFVALILLRALASAIIFAASHVKKGHSPALRLALGNIYRHGNLTPSIALALGLSLTLVVTLGTIDINLRHQLENSVPRNAPDFFFTDIPNGDADSFRELFNQFHFANKVDMAPALRARIIKINDVPARQIKGNADSLWVLNSDRNVSYADAPPIGTKIIAGKWWQKNSKLHEVSMSAHEARALHFKIGDQLTVNVLGRPLTATIANLRDVEWDSLSLNFVLIFSPATLSGAPHTWVASAKLDQTSLQNVAELTRAIGQKFPSVTVISVHDTLTSAGAIVDQILTIVRAAVAIAFIVAILVLAGAFTAGNEQRTREMVIMKVLGATRFTLLCSLIYEYLILGIFTSLFAYGIGSISGYAFAKYSLDITSAMISTKSAIEITLAVLVLSVAFGLLNLWVILGKKPGSRLKDV